MIGSQQPQVRIQQPLSRHLFLCQSKRQWQAIINARFSAKSRSPHLFTLRKRDTAHHRGLVSLRISDGKFVNHTTEMILWSMILTLHHQSCPYDKPGISQQIGEEKLGTIQQNGLSWYILHIWVWISANFVVTSSLSKLSLCKSLRHLLMDGQTCPPHVRTT